MLEVMLEDLIFDAMYGDIEGFERYSDADYGEINRATLAERLAKLISSRYKLMSVETTLLSAGDIAESIMKKLQELSLSRNELYNIIYSAPKYKSEIDYFDIIHDITELLHQDYIILRK